MINKEELRLGNIILYEHTYHKITGILNSFCTSIWLRSQDEYQYSHYYKDPELKPVPVTKEMLDKVSHITILNDPGNKIQYLHELQNLYYFYIGEEMPLEI